MNDNEFCRYRLNLRIYIRKKTVFMVVLFISLIMIYIKIDFAFIMRFKGRICEYVASICSEQIRIR